jgi:hypothetical protein
MISKHHPDSKAKDDRKNEDHSEHNFGHMMIPCLHAISLIYNADGKNEVDELCKKLPRSQKSMCIQKHIGKMSIERDMPYIKR